MIDKSESRSMEPIKFEVVGESFTIKSDVEREYFLNLVDELVSKLEDLRKKFPTLSKIKLVILTALDYLDELFKLRKQRVDEEQMKSIAELTESLVSIIDREENSGKIKIEEDGFNGSKM
ncbi:MAG: hypothetical protein DRP54_02080 [Spirochaetes bacterium]|nr:MAG: hypothetical protein DRP54_02080 [Spirochaetota bacterium]